MDLCQCRVIVPMKPRILFLVPGTWLSPVRTRWWSHASVQTADPAVCPCSCPGIPGPCRSPGRRSAGCQTPDPIADGHPSHNTGVHQTPRVVCERRIYLCPVC